MTIAEATKRGIRRLRCPNWVNPEAYIRIDILQDKGKNCHGPWMRLFDRVTQERIGEPTPQTVLITIGNTLEADDIVEYTGPRDPADTD